MEEVMAHLTTRQVKQLLEIDSAGPGIRAEVQELISRLTSGGVGPKTDDPRKAQAKRLWDKGWGRELGFDSFDAYLETIPELPEELTAHDERFPELVLVDARVSVQAACRLLGIDCCIKDEDLTDPEDRETAQVSWMRCQNGRRNAGKSVKTCRDEFAENEFGLTATEGLALFAQKPDQCRNRGMDFPASVNRGHRGHVASLDWFYERPKLYWDWHVYEHDYCVSASRRE